VATEQLGVLDHFCGAAVGTPEVDGPEGLQQVCDGLLDDVAGEVVGVDQQRDAGLVVVAVLCGFPRVATREAFTTRKGLSWAPPWQRWQRQV
jgi:hypothetical protein